MTTLFTPLTLRALTIDNRLWVPPMCQYSAVAGDGRATDWHLVHYGAFAQGGFGLITVEATAVTPEGRISAFDLGLWDDDQIAPLRRITDFVHTQGRAIGIQLAHAGRKASTQPWLPGYTDGPLLPDEGGWTTVAPSALAFESLPAPHALTTAEIADVVQAFADAARRALAAGFDVVELHAAHGYLLHEFLSPLSNQRTDQYGGSFDNRVRLVVEVVEAVRTVWPRDLPLVVRLSGTDWIDGGWDEVQSTALAALLKGHGVDLISVSSGGAVVAPIKAVPGYQVPLAAAIRAGGLPVAAVGLILTPEQAADVLDSGAADAVLLGRAALRDPHFPQRAAHVLGIPAPAGLYAAPHIRGVFR